jgi:hypothetical protein
VLMLQFHNPRTSGFLPVSFQQILHVLFTSIEYIIFGCDTGARAYETYVVRRNVLRGLKMTRLGTSTVPASTLITGNALTRM